MIWSYRPLTSWPGELTPEHKRYTSQFTASWSDTFQKLAFEAEWLAGDGDVLAVIEVALDPSDFRRDGGIRAAAKAAHPGVVLSFDSPFGPLRFSCDRFYAPTWGKGARMTDWEHNIRAIALGLESLRRIERYGMGTGREQYVGFNALGSGRPMPAPTITLERASRLLIDAAGAPASYHPLDMASDDRRRDVWRAAAMRHHPDRGGDTAQFQELTEAWELIQSVVSRRG